MKQYLTFFEKYPIIAVSIFATFLPIIIFTIRRSNKKPLRVLFLWMALKVLFDLVGLHFASQSKNDLFICNGWVLISFMCNAWFFYEVFVDERMKNKIKYISIVYCSIFLIDFIICNPDFSDFYSHRYVSISFPLRSAFLIYFCLIFYQEVIKELYIDHIERSAIFWAVSSILIYNATSLFTTVINHQEFSWDSKRMMVMIMYIPYVMDTFQMAIISGGLLAEKK